MRLCVVSKLGSICKYVLVSWLKLQLVYYWTLQLKVKRQQEKSGHSGTCDQHRCALLNKGV